MLKTYLGRLICIFNGSKFSHLNMFTLLFVGTVVKEQGHLSTPSPSLTAAAQTAAGDA